MEKDFGEQVSRNLLGIQYEKQGDVEKAIDLYEQNIAECFDGNHPYDRLAIIYRRKKLYEEEVRVLEQAIYVFENIVHEERTDRAQKLHKFKERLNKAKSLL